MARRSGSFGPSDSAETSFREACGFRFGVQTLNHLSRGGPASPGVQWERVRERGEGEGAREGERAREGEGEGMERERGRGLGGEGEGEPCPALSLRILPQP